MNWQVKILTHPLTANLGLYIIQETGGKHYVAKPVELEFEEVENGALYPDPTLKLPPFETKAFMKAFVDALEKAGIEPESVSKVRGLLEATKYHLEDMRKLVFRK